MVYLGEHLSLERRNLTSYVNLALVGERTANFFNRNFNIGLFLKKSCLLGEECAHAVLKRVKISTYVADGRNVAPAHNNSCQLVFSRLVFNPCALVRAMSVLGVVNKGVALHTRCGNYVNFLFKLLRGFRAEFTAKLSLLFDN